MSTLAVQRQLSMRHTARLALTIIDECSYVEPAKRSAWLATHCPVSLCSVVGAAVSIFDEADAEERRELRGAVGLMIASIPMTIGERRRIATRSRSVPNGCVRRIERIADLLREVLPMIRVTFEPHTTSRSLMQMSVRHRPEGELRNGSGT